MCFKNFELSKKSVLFLFCEHSARPRISAGTVPTVGWLWTVSVLDLDPAWSHKYALTVINLTKVPSFRCKAFGSRLP